MSRGYWRIILAIVGCLSILFLGYGTVHFYKSSEQQQSDYSYQPAGQPRLGIPVEGQPPPQGYEPNCQNPQTDEDADLCAQWAAVAQVSEANRLAGLNLKFALASLWATFVATLLLVWNLIETRETSRRELRAYVFFKSEVEKPLDAAGKMTAKWGFINTGQTPARNLRVIVKWNVSTPDPDESFFDAEFTTGGTNGYLGGGLDTFSPRVMKILAADIPEVLAGRKEIFLFGMASYEDIFGRKHTLTFRRRMYRSGGFKHFYGMASGEGAT